MDTLALWQSSVDAPLPVDATDWGAVARRSVGEIAFRVHNDSIVYTAAGVRVAVADFGPVASPSVAAWHFLSTDAQTFTAAVDLGDLPPGVTTPLITLRRVTPSTASAGAWQFLLTATAVGGWAYA